MTNTGIKGPALRVRSMLEAITRRQIVVRLVIGFTIGGAIATADIDVEIHILWRVTVVIVTSKDRTLNHVVSAL